MQGMNLGFFSAIITLLLEIEGSSSAGSSSLGSEHLDQKFAEIEDNYESAPSKREYLLHRERDVRFLEMELNQALARRGKFKTKKGEELNEQLIDVLASKKSAAEYDFYRVHVIGEELGEAKRYLPGYLTEFMSDIARKSTPDVVADWERVYGTHETQNPVHSHASTSGASTSGASTSGVSTFGAFFSGVPFFKYFKRSKSKPDVDYVLGPNKKYLKKNKNSSKKFTELMKQTNKACSKLPIEGNVRHPATSIYEEHSNWLLDQRTEAAKDYKAVSSFKKQPQLVERRDPKEAKAKLKEELKKKGFE